MSNKWIEEKDVLLEGLDGKRREVTNTLLDTERKHLSETAVAGMTAIGNDSVAKFDKVIFPVIRRVTPALIAMELVGVQPMNAPVGIVRAMRVRYAQATAAGAGLVITDSNAAGEEGSAKNLYEYYSMLKNTDTAYTGIESILNDPDALTRYMEHDGGREMNVEIVKKTIEAKTRKLQAKWTLESQEDAMALHGVSIEKELVSALSDEIIRELDRELLSRLESLAGGVTVFDFANADGRYASEKFTALVIALSDLSNQIAIATKRGGATWIVVSPNVLVALRHASNGSFVPAAASPDLSPSSTLFAGTLNGSVRVFVDVHAATDKVLLGYKGSSDWDTGLVYSPYIPLMSSGVITDPTSYDPQMGLRTRYALTDFTSTADSLGNSGDYYRRANVVNLVLGIS
jgi:hypothetical protein